MKATLFKGNDNPKSIEDMVADAVKEAVQAHILPKIAREVKQAVKDAMVEMEPIIKPMEEDMPVKVEKVKGGKYKVSTPGGTKAKGTTKEKAMKQEKVLNMAEHGVKIKKKK